MHPEREGNDKFSLSEVLLENSFRTLYPLVLGQIKNIT